MFEFEDPRKYKAPDPCIPDVTDPVTRRKFPNKGTEDYWYKQYYNCVWGIELHTNSGDHQQATKLIRLKSHYDLYFLRKGYSGAELYVQHERRRRKSKLPPQVLTTSGDPDSQAPPQKGASAQQEALSSRTRSKLPLPGRSPRVLQEAIERTQNKRTQFKFIIQSEDDFELVLPKNFNCGIPLTEADFQFIFRRFQKAVYTDLQVEVEEDHYPYFVQKLKEYIEKEHEKQLKNESQPQSEEVELATSVSPPKDTQATDQPSVSDPTQLQGQVKATDSSNQEESLISFCEFHSFTESYPTPTKVNLEDLLRAREDRVQQNIVDSGLGSVITEHYYSYTTGPDSEPVTSAEEAEADTESETEEVSKQTTTGDPGDPDSSSSSDPDEPADADQPSPTGKGNPQRDSDSSAPNPGQSATPVSTQGSDSSLGGQPPGSNPPPNPNNSDQSTGSKAQKPIMATEEQKDHHAAHEALAGRLIKIREGIDAHQTATGFFSLSQVEILQEDLKAMAAEISNLAKGCYRHFENTSTDKARDKACASQSQLEADYYQARINLTDIHKSLNTNITGTKLKTPKMSVPKFNGNHKDWPMFKSEFSNLVANVSLFSSSEKLRLLIEALADGEAKENISDLQVNDGNWSIAWKRIKDRYDSPRETAHAALRPLMELPSLMSQSESGLHKLISTVRTTRAQLNQVELGTVTEAEVLYLHFIMARLDTRTINEFNTHLTDNKVPALEDCITFLEQKAKNVGLTKEIRSNAAAAAPTKPGHSKKEHHVRKVMMAVSDSETGFSSDASNRSVKLRRSKSKDSRRRSKSPGRSRRPTVAVVKGRRSWNRERSTSRDAKFTARKPHVSFAVAPCGFCGNVNHRINACKDYANLNVNQRRDWVKSSGRCFNCLSQHKVSECPSKWSCSACKKRHHTSLHLESDQSPSRATVNSIYRQLAVMGEESGLLPTAVVHVIYQRKSLDARALIDTGAQNSFVTTSLVRRLGLPISPGHDKFSVAGGKDLRVHGKTSFRMQSRAHPSKTFTVEAYVLTEITSDLPNSEIDIRGWRHLENLTLADPEFNIPGPIEILLGIPVVDKIMRNRKIRGRQGTPGAYSTELGYILMGPYPKSSAAPVLNVRNTENVEFNLERFWNVEEPPFQKIFTPQEKLCEEHYRLNTIRLDNGRYEVKLPFKPDAKPLGNSFDMALTRWLAVERKLMKLPKLLEEYNKQLQDYLDKGQMEQVPEDEIDKKPHYYMPHHAVIKESSTSTKVRVVFDASAKTSNGVSLNDNLMPGPVIQPKLCDHLIRFRLKLYALLADIKTMFREIGVNIDDCDYLRILWRQCHTEPLKIWRLVRLAFGLVSSPWLAIRTLSQAGIDEGPWFPKAQYAVQKEFYVDDFMMSVDSLDEAKEMVRQIKSMLDKAHLSLRKWSSNSEEVLAYLPEEDRETQIPMSIDETDTIKTLGIQWNPVTDLFQFRLNFELNRQHTKRSMLSDISKVYDPLGWLSPTIIKAKIIMQVIWMRDLQWDDDLPSDIMAMWDEFAATLPELEKIRIPRHLGYAPEINCELHGFCDASEKAYSCVIYLRGVHEKKVFSNMVVAKTRVAPLKVMTIPRLELQGAVMLAQLLAHVKETMGVPFATTHMWTDSMIVLHWIHSAPHKWKIFVGNRIQQIHEVSQPNQWHHVKTEDNPADCASRGISPDQLPAHPIWWHGPHWLSQPEYEIPEFTPAVEKTGEEKTPLVALQITEQPTTLLDSLEKLSSWTRMIRVVAMLDRIRYNKSFKICWENPPTPGELGRAQDRIVHLVQDQAYELKKVNRDRQLRALNAFYDQNQFLRVGGRLRNSNLPFNMKHPMILPGDSPIVRAMILHYHRTFAHAGLRTIHNHIRQQYWIIGGTKAIKSVIHRCILCFRFRAKPMQQLMGPLPGARVNPSRPFLHVGVDFAGPYEIRNFSGNRAARIKTWICLFTCFTSRAIHLELVSTLSYEGFLLAFRRFMARRGRPTDCYSDNGTNFVGANNFLQSTAFSLRAMQEAEDGILPGLNLDMINWHFNPPRAPHSGGVWEACVKLVKDYLKKILDKDSAYSWEEFETILVFTEALVNSRPLTPISNDPEDLDVLTPAHFLIGHPLLWIPEHDLTHIKLNRLSKFQLIQRRSAEMWERWRNEYLTHLQQRQKWTAEQPNLAVGDMVLLLEDNAPPLQWKLGRVKETHPGADGLVRVTTVESGGKEFTRPITKLAKLPMEENEKEAMFEADDDEEVPELIEDVESKEQMETKEDQLGPVQVMAVRRRNIAHTWLTNILAFYTLTINVASANHTDESENRNESFQDRGNHYGQRLHEIKSPELVIIAMVLALLGCFGNLLTIAALSQARRLRGQPATWLIMNLSGSNVIFSVLALPMQAWKHHSPEWMNVASWCKGFTFIYYGNMACTLFAITAVTINRLVRIVYSASYDKIFTRKWTIVMIVSSWMASYGLMLIPLLELWGRLGLRRGKLPSCTICKDEDGSTPKHFLMTTGVLGPVLTILCCYTAIYRHVKKSRADLHKFNGYKDTPNTKSDKRLTFSIACIFVGYLVCFLPVMCLYVIDPERKRFSFLIHTATSVLAWSQACVNQVIYAATNVYYRNALRNFVCSGGMKRALTTMNISTIATVALTLLLRLGGTNGLVLTNNSLATIANPCQIPWNAHHEIPTCTQAVRWLHVQANGEICLREQTCKNKFAVSSDARNCKFFSDTECPVRNPTIDLDRMQCQTTDLKPNLYLLERPGVRADLCSIGDYTMKPCRHFTEQVREVPVAINAGKVYPLTALNIRQEPQLEDLASYSCYGKCDKGRCSQGQCIGDEVFCRNFRCLPKEEHEESEEEDGNQLLKVSQDTKDEQKDDSQMNCFCKYNTRTDVYKIITLEGEVIPECWGHLQLPTRKEDLSKTNAVYQCNDCTLECTRTGIKVQTPGKVPKYIKAQKNPGFVSVVPDSHNTEVYLTNHMLATAGKTHVEIWFPDFDTPSMMEINCPRIPVCELITCFFCLSRWGNVSCYTGYHWLIILAFGIVVTIIILCLLYVSRMMLMMSWWISWPFRKCLALSRQRRNHKGYKRVPHAEPEHVTVELDHFSPNPYMPTTTLTRPKRNRSSERRNKGLRHNVTSSFTLLFLLACLSIALGCSNFAAMSASNRECRNVDTDKVQCSLRLNTRLALSPLGQASCFRIEDAHGKLLGTITVETKSVDLKCVKQLLYYVPKAVANCHSAFQCYNLYSSAECNGWKCRDFGINSTLKAFKDSIKHLGWSFCLAMRHPKCPWILTRDCNYYRVYLTNPTNEAFAVYNCPEWVTSVHMVLTLHMGDKITRNQTRLQAGIPEIVDNIEFTLVSVSTPKVPVLNECIISKGKQAALAPCNDREEMSLSKIGEIQCSSKQAAQEVDHNCIANPNIVRAMPDLDGVKCLSELVNPDKLMAIRTLPLKLEDGILVPHEEDVIFETSSNTLLELQISTENYVLTKQVQQSSCTASVIKLEGCYSCLSGANLIMEAKVNQGEQLASLECPEVGFYVPVHLTEQDTKHSIIVKLDSPEIDMKCELKCSINKVVLRVTGHLQFLANVDVRDDHMTVSYEPLDTGTGFSFLSLTGLGWYNWLVRGIIASVVLVFIGATMWISFNIAIKKLL